MCQIIGPLYTRRQAELSGWTVRAHNFALFMNEVNWAVVQATGHSVRHFPDWDWAASYESGLPVKHVVVTFLEAQKEFS